MTRRHRILYVVGQLGAGGLERQLWYLLSAMDRERLRPGVAVWNHDARAPYVERIEALGVPLYPLTRRGGYAARVRELIRIARSTRPEVVHAYSFRTNFAAWAAARASGAVPVGSLRNDYLAERRALGWAGGALCSLFPQTLIVNSASAQESVRTARGFTHPRRAIVVPNGLDLALFTASPLPAGRRFEIAGVGRLYPQKRWHDQLEALALLERQSGREWRFRLCGEGPLDAQLRGLAQQLGLAARVEFLGYQPDVTPVLRGCHALALSSGYEGTPNVVLEALACGRPVVATAAGDVPRVVQDGRTGFVVPVGDRHALADRLQRLAENAGLAEEMGRAARQWAEAELGLDRLVARTLEACRQAGWRGCPEEEASRALGLGTGVDSRGGRM